MASQTAQKVDAIVIGCGYLGSRVAHAWQAEGKSVAVTTRSESRAKEFREQGFEPIVCNVLDQQSLLKLPDAKTVLHAVGFDRNSSQSMREVYVDGLKNVLGAISPSTQTFIHISSTSVYGQTAGEEVDEQSACEPTRENGQICLEAEQLVEASALNSVTLRLAGIYGPGRLLARIKQRQQQIPVPGNPDAWLNLVHVHDCVRAVQAAAASQLCNETVLVADDCPITRRDYYTLLAELLQAPPPDFAPNLDDPKGKRGAGKRCRNTKLHQQLLNELTFPTIREGLPHAIQGFDTD